MDERIRFVARLLDGEKMAPLCAEFGISRKTSYKIFDRYQDCGVAAFTDRSRRPYRQANRLPPQLEAVIVRLKREYPGWGAPKIREKLRRRNGPRRAWLRGLDLNQRPLGYEPFSNRHQSQRATNNTS
jgi:putative transposase